MKKSLASFLALLGLAAGFAIAQEAPPPPPAESGLPRPHLLPRGAETRLSLTDEQKQQLKDLENETKARLERILTPAQAGQLKSMGPPPPRGQENQERKKGGADARPPVEQEQAETASASTSPALPAGVTRQPVVFSGGHETVPVDHGRPVALIAAALGVKDEVFREAFSHVRPAGPGRGGPTEAEARTNKQALMSRLEQYGISNDRLNTVSNFYRYASWEGGIWKHQEAVANALVKEGGIVGFEITSGGYGYTTPPTASVPGLGQVNLQAKLSYGKDMETNGAVSKISVSPSK